LRIDKIEVKYLGKESSPGFPAVLFKKNQPSFYHKTYYFQGHASFGQRHLQIFVEKAPDKLLTDKN